MDQKTIQFIEKARQVHGDRYDYSAFTYRGFQVKGTIICQTHGPFEKTPLHHLQRQQGCKLCKREEMSQRQTMTLDQFIAKAKEVHGDANDYSQFVYQSSTTKGLICCNIHGIIFKQTPGHHLSGHGGCDECTRVKSKQTMLARYGAEHHSKTPQFREKVQKTSLERFGVEHHSKTPGFKDQMRSSSLERYGVEYASQLPEFQARVQATNLERFGAPHYNMTHIPKESIPILSDRESLVGLLRTNSLREVAIMLGIGETSLGKRCHKLGIDIPRSSYETAILAFLSELGIAVKHNDRSFINGEIDFLIHDYKLGIEFDGLYWHHEDIRPKRYHLDKLLQMKEKGYRLITIFEDEWLERRKVVESRLLHALGMSPRGKGARKLTVAKIPAKVALAFVKKYHIQGATQSGFIRYGAFDNNDLVAVMTFSQPRVCLGRKSGAVEMLRFATDGKNYPGVASKLFTTFVREYQPDSVISFADRRWSEGRLYEELGFKLKNPKPQPSRWYIDGRRRLHRFNYRKDRIKHLVEDGDHKTEGQIAQELGKSWIWDCGSLTYRWTK